MKMQNNKVSISFKVKNYWASKSQASKCLHIALGALACLSLSFSALSLVLGSLSQLNPSYLSFAKGLKKIQGALIASGIAIPLLGLQRVNAHHNKQKITETTQRVEEESQQKNSKTERKQIKKVEVNPKEEVFDINILLKEEKDVLTKTLITFYCKSPTSREKYVNLYLKIEAHKKTHSKSFQGFMTEITRLGPPDESSKTFHFRQEMEDTFGSLTPKLLMSKIHKIDLSNPDSLQIKDIFPEQHTYLQEKQSQLTSSGIKMESPEFCSRFFIGKSFKKAFILGKPMPNEKTKSTFQSFFLFPSSFQKAIAKKHDNLANILKNKNSLKSEKKLYQKLQSELTTSLASLGLSRESVQENLPSFLGKVSESFYKKLLNPKKENRSFLDGLIDNKTQEKLLPFNGDYKNIPSSLINNNTKHAKEIMALLSPTQDCIPLTKLLEKINDIKEALTEFSLDLTQKEIDSFVDTHAEAFKQNLFHNEKLANLPCMQDLHHFSLQLSTHFSPQKDKNKITDLKKAYLKDFLQVTKRGDKESILKKMGLYISLQKEGISVTKDQIKTLSTNGNLFFTTSSFFNKNIKTTIEINGKKLVYTKKNTEKTIAILNLKLPPKKTIKNKSSKNVIESKKKNTVEKAKIKKKNISLEEKYPSQAKINTEPPFLFKPFTQGLKLEKNELNCLKELSGIIYASQASIKSFSRKKGLYTLELSKDIEYTLKKKIKNGLVLLDKHGKVEKNISLNIPKEISFEINNDSIQFNKLEITVKARKEITRCVKKLEFTKEKIKITLDINLFDRAILKLGAKEYSNPLLTLSGKTLEIHRSLLTTFQKKKAIQDEQISSNTPKEILPQTLQSFGFGFMRSLLQNLSCKLVETNKSGQMLMHIFRATNTEKTLFSPLLTQLAEDINLTIPQNFEFHLLKSATHTSIFFTQPLMLSSGEFQISFKGFINEGDKISPYISFDREIGKKISTNLKSQANDKKSSFYILINLFSHLTKTQIIKNIPKQEIKMSFEDTCMLFSLFQEKA